MMKKFLVLALIFVINRVDGFGADPKKIDNTIRSLHGETVELVDMWSNEIGEKLTELSMTMTRPDRVKESFRHLHKHLYKIDGSLMVEDIARDITSFMQLKVEAVQRIAEYAEFLSYHRIDDAEYKNETRYKYFYFDTDNLQYTDENIARSMEISEDVFTLECHWWCTQKHLPALSDNIFTPDKLKELFHKRETYENEEMSCDCDNLKDALRTNDSYLELPLADDPHFNVKVNFNTSVVKVATNIWERDMSVLEGIRWSEPLDLVFKKNLINDSELTWQYFASPNGFMRHYPAVKWSHEQYDQTYDFRTRSWYTEAMTSPKDIIILIDRSGSMKGMKKKLTHHIVNDILDTLNDNDFVNIYTFNNVTSPLVDCFNDTLVQANEENLRLFREYLPVYDIEYAANITAGLEKAFQILYFFRQKKLSANCNQAIMLITEGLDYPYSLELFNDTNRSKDFPVRIFTYSLSNEKEDEKHLEFIACTNMGYYVNITQQGDIREKILQYLRVMSRPINYNYQRQERQSPIWSYLYVDLADRRLSNWLWTKDEGIRQRDVFLDHVKRRIERLQQKYTSLNHMLLQEHHEYEDYEINKVYDYMTTVSLPVYGRRQNEYNLTGVAGIDVPIKLFRARIPHDKIGVNGYAFIITNNGYILMHPEHITEFEYILKPTFNRVDILETEILDDNNEPRIFGDDILRDHMLKKTEKKVTLKMKYTLDDMKRIIRTTRHYYFTEIGPFTLCIVLPDVYGHVKVNRSATKASQKDLETDYIVEPKDWTIHPDWIYCKKCKNKKEPLDKLAHAYYNEKLRTPLYDDLLHDLEKTAWFDDTSDISQSLISKYLVHQVFLSTSSGLTRWKTFNNGMFQSPNGQPEFASNRSIDEDWYQRAVEENLKNEDMFIYSVPFEISVYENNTMIRGTRAIFVERDNMKFPVAVVGLEFNHQAMYRLYNQITTKSMGKNKITCESDYLNCFILDNNAYILLSDEIEYTGRFIGAIRPDIMYYLVKEKVFEPTRMFDYQATCQFEPPEAPDPTDMRCFVNKTAEKFRSGSPRHPNFYKLILQNILKLVRWLMNLIYLSYDYALSLSPDQIVKEETITFARLKVNKTVPTPCDREMWLFTLKDQFRSTFYENTETKFDCNWPYVVKKIPKTNLLFLALFVKCPMTTSNSYLNSPEPTPILYYQRNKTVSLPCYIATMNNYTREAYMKCYKRDRREDRLITADNRSYCGHVWN
ncbi:voltage-dependent calcium channel subunit alpha-2/delta-3-like isoform X2 [Anthonomus grandis grandis]|uniref:voltage-dependent calcium channel subunit alpha-2/delta-3-like isoform X2 n=1 Tax=Anthonomus grandis grandis TaxID=2921223 RepID=UPI00216644D2|nr:voltage-dependent calcium channel subunit alpha-2/delta-3-like isoform X2 [Anthonomus grandis grandis]